MASKSESGHPINVANLEDLISFCVGYGNTYNPSRTALQTQSLNTLLTNAQNSISAVNSAKTSLLNAGKDRQTALAPIKKLCTKIINALDATDASDKTVKNAKSINNKIQGKRSTPKPSKEEGEINAKTISTSQQSSDSLLENFDKLIQLISSEPLYNPNETDLQVSTLTTLLGSLRSTNSAAINAYTNFSNALITRNSILYTPLSGLVDIAGDVKKYVKSVYGASSPQYLQISKLEFKKIK